MNKKWMIWVVICLKSTNICYAQWTEQDSLWLQNVLTGKDTIRLNPETIRAIRDGMLIRPGETRPELLSAPPILPITKDFTGVGVPDSVIQGADHTTLPPAVYMRNQLLGSDTLPNIMKEAYTFPKPLVVKDRIQIGNSPVSVKAGVQNLFQSEVKDGQHRGSVGTSVGASFSLEDMLRYIFWPSERQKKKNRKRAENLKYYNESP